MPERSAAWILLLFVTGLTGLPSRAEAQGQARVRVQENFRREPNGVVLGRLTPGTTVRVVGRDGRWTQVELTGFVWLPSLQASAEADFDLVVSATGGENLRAGPSGEIVARLEQGALLEEVAREPAWARVSRTGWVWSASLEDAAPAPTARPPAQPATSPPAPAGPAAQRPGGFARVGPSGGHILASPDGDTLGVAATGTDLQVVGREGSWVRVRLEGWMWMPAADGGEAVPDEEPGALEPRDLRADPQRHRGRVVAWSLQYISLERAEAVRTDFFEGEPFLLTRFGGPDGPFVYVALPPERLTEVEGLVPLERISVTARVRTGASALTDTPIVDLLSIERSREAP